MRRKSPLARGNFGGRHGACGGARGTVHGTRGTVHGVRGIRGTGYGVRGTGHGCCGGAGNRDQNQPPALRTPAVRGRLAGASRRYGPGRSRFGRGWGTTLAVSANGSAAPTSTSLSRRSAGPTKRSMSWWTSSTASTAAGPGSPRATSRWPGSARTGRKRGDANGASCRHRPRGRHALIRCNGLPTQQGSRGGLIAWRICPSTQRVRARIKPLVSPAESGQAMFDRVSSPLLPIVNV
jgi:hypothetical protein